MTSASETNAVSGWLLEAGRSAKLAAVLVRPSPGKLVVSVQDHPPRHYTDDDLTLISDRVGAIPRRLTFADGTVFETEDNAGIDRLLSERLAASETLLSRLEVFHPRLILVALLAIALVYATIRYALPVLANVAAAVTPTPVVELIDRGALETIDRVFLTSSTMDEARQEEIRAGFAALTLHAGSDKPSLRLLFRDGGIIGPNAFALPGGTILMTDQLVRLAGNDDEIFGVLAHEIAHVEERHSLRQIYRSLGFVALIAMIGGDSGEIVEDVLAQGSLLLTLSYSRRFESQADRRAVDLMKAAGRDPAALATVLERITEKCRNCGETSWFTTHPGTEGRAEAIRRRERQ
ncbi:MAG TPA: M48 family metallopeptidase [Afifellaceae bacterium]|nr:M48 family metallopeptidase [Afifellaceae bacterium]